MGEEKERERSGECQEENQNLRVKMRERKRESERRWRKMRRKVDSECHVGLPEANDSVKEKEKNFLGSG